MTSTIPETLSVSEAWEAYRTFINEKHDGLTYPNQQKPLKYRYDLHANKCEGDIEGIPFPQDIVGRLKNITNPQHPRYLVRDDARWDSRFLKYADDATITEARNLFDMWVTAWIDDLNTHKKREKWIAHFPGHDDRFVGNRRQAVQIICNYYEQNNEHPTVTYTPSTLSNENDDKEVDHFRLSKFLILFGGG